MVRGVVPESGREVKLRERFPAGTDARAEAPAMCMVGCQYSTWPASICFA